MTARAQKAIVSRDDREFFIILAGCGMGYGLLIAALSLVPAPPPARTDVRSLPPRVAKLILDTPATPPPVIAPPRASLVETKPVTPEVPKPTPPSKQTDARPVPPRPARVEEGRGARTGEATDTTERLEADATAREHDRTVAKQSGLLKALSETGTGGTGHGNGSGLERILSDISVLSNPSLPASGRGGGVPGTVDEGTGGGGTRPSVDDLVAGLKNQGNGTIILSAKDQARVESALIVQGSGTTRSAESIRHVTKALDTWLKFKYREALRAQPTLGVSLTVEFTIAPQGGVSDCRVASSDLRNPQLENTILKRFCLLHFAPLPEGSDDEVTVRYPIDFEALSS